MTTVEKLRAIVDEFLISHDGYTREELHDLYRMAKLLRERAAFTLVEFNWEENLE